MAGQSKRTKAPAPMEFPRPTAQLVPPPTAQLVPPPAMFGPGAWLPPRPPQSMAASSPPCWIAGLQPPGMAGSSAQGLFWRPSVGIGGSAFAEPTAENLEDYDLQAWGLDSHQPGGFLNLINNTSSHTQAMNNGSSSQPINDGNENNGGDPSPSPTMSDSSPYSDDSDELAPSKIMEVYVAEQTVLDSIAERLMTKIKAKLTAGLSHGRSGPRKRIRRDHGGAHERLVEDYFAEEPLYPESMFRTRFRMNKHLFLRIVNALGQWSPYFTYREDCAGRIGLSPLQKCTAAMRMLAYGTPADALDEYLKIGKCTALECLDKFARGVIEVFGEEYLRRPNREDVERLLQVNESRGFPGMLGSIDCMHWRWEKCPLAWRGQFTRGDYGVPTMVLEAVASQDLRIWHAFFGIAGSNNDLNVLNQSPLFFDALKGEAPQVQFSVNGNEYNTGYYLADGIYPEWAAFMKTIPLPQTEKHKLFAKHQEGARKDVERAFGVLQSRFTIVRRPARLWQRKSVGRIMKAYVILHNMIVEDEREQATIHIDLNEVPGASFALPPEVNVGGNLCFADVLRRKATIRARPQHTQLKNDLVEHIWHRFQNNRRN